MPSRLLIEGWRGIHHSYALVAQSHCLCLAGRAAFELRFRDLPYPSPAWQRTRGIFAAGQERLLDAIPPPAPEFTPELTLRFEPERADFTPPRAGRKFVFGTPEWRVLPATNVSVRSAAEVAESIEILTPSRWTAAAYERFGFPRERIHVVPHGVDPALLRPDAASRDSTRKALGIDERFVFMSAGAMTWNKGIDLLLQAFAAVVLADAGAVLVLKGADDLYRSRELVHRALDALPTRARELVAAHLLYYGNTLSAHDMGAFLRAADCYVSPYRAEGFNLPVLEAAACGVAVICTAGGSTDDFVDASFADRIDSRLVAKSLSDTQTGEALEPDVDHLIELMLNAAHDRERTRTHGDAGASHVKEHYTWGKTTDLLLTALHPGA